MSTDASDYLTTRELAELLRIKERKVYDLAASGEIPCSRALGKLLFQRAAVEAWLARHGSGFAAPAADRPKVVLGSHDPLLEWALRESRSGLATFLDGSLDGLERFARGEGVATGLHLFEPETEDWNRAQIGARFARDPVVLVEWAWRQRGLILAPGNPKAVESIADLGGSRLIPRQREAGSQRLLEHLLAEAGLGADEIETLQPARSESDAALAVLEGKADAAFGLEALARRHRLDFVPVVRERFDLLVWRRDWFEPPMQSLLDFCRSDALVDRAHELGGYDLSGFGTVHFNGP